MTDLSELKPRGIASAWKKRAPIVKSLQSMNVRSDDRIVRYNRRLDAQAQYKELARCQLTNWRETKHTFEVGDSWRRVGFDVYAMKPSGAKAIAYKSTIAPIVQGNYSAPGGAQQVLVPNRAEWTKPVKIGNIPGVK